MKYRIERYIKDIVYGANYGIITTFAVVMGVAGASLSHTVILVVGLANVLADGFSMAASNYLGTKSECEAMEGTKEECGNDHIWRSAWYTFISFAVAGMIPLIPFLIPSMAENAIVASSVATALGLFAIGASRAKFIKKNFMLAGFEVLFVGGIAAILAFVVGVLIKSIIG